MDAATGTAGAAAFFDGVTGASVVVGTGADTDAGTDFVRYFVIEPAPAIAAVENTLLQYISKRGISQLATENANNPGFYWLHYWDMI
jgi:hypothetical protein